MLNSLPFFILIQIYMCSVCCVGVRSVSGQITRLQLPGHRLVTPAGAEFAHWQQLGTTLPMQHKHTADGCSYGCIAQVCKSELLHLGWIAKDCKKGQAGCTETAAEAFSDLVLDLSA